MRPTRAQEILNVAAAAAGLPAPRPYDLEDHHELATRIASEAITLLRNEEDLLPLSAGTSVALIGDLADTPRFQGSGSSQVNPTRVEAPRELLEAEGEGARGLVLEGYASGYERHGGTSDALIAEAVALAERADVADWAVGLAGTVSTSVSTSWPNPKASTAPTCVCPRARIASSRLS